ncbi:hypothetical protein HYC85_007729 [Camellia sinensis]|uniref:CASP-like protein n=1 Tax=Camellia sinensis TaxID=4442 RepID=A0A7J7HPS4_CAMSI|nr:hypothetical protein HYC85_007729 [Camellia sinensis]
MEALLRLSSTLLLVLTACLVGVRLTLTCLKHLQKASMLINMEEVILEITSEVLMEAIDPLVTGLPSSFHGRSQPHKSNFVAKCHRLPFKLSNSTVNAPFALIHTNATVYLVVATNSAALEASFLAITGASNLQWMKLCDKYTRFCIQIGGALLCGCAASLSLALISILSGYSLFRLYSPKRFFLLKARTLNLKVATVIFISCFKYSRLDQILENSKILEDPSRTTPNSLEYDERLRFFNNLNLGTQQQRR